MTDAAGNSDQTPHDRTNAPQSVPLRLKLGRIRLPARRAVSFAPGDVVKLDADVDADVVLCCKGEPYALGRPVTVHGRLGVQIRELL